MEIRIDTNSIQEILNNVAKDSINEAFSGYTLKSTMEKTISNSVIPEIMTKAIVEAASKIDIETLTSALAKEIAIAVTKGIQAVVQDSMIELIMNMRKVPEYDDKLRKSVREELTAKIFRSKGGD